MHASAQQRSQQEHRRFLQRIVTGFQRPIGILQEIPKMRKFDMLLRFRGRNGRVRRKIKDSHRGEQSENSASIGRDQKRHHRMFEYETKRKQEKVRRAGGKREKLH